MLRARPFWQKAWIFLALFATTASVGHAQTPSLELGPAELSQAIEKARDRVEEFRFIRAEAKRLGVRAWLFGGTAAAFAHYVNWDEKRQRGDTRFQPDRFDYRYFNIYRSTQDLDIVIDGPESKAQELQKLLASRFQYLQGSKSAWEVRLLRKPSVGGVKEALLNNPDYLNQDTDSNSTGMIELTEAPRAKSAPVVRDLKAFDLELPPFLTDVAKGRLTYYYDPKAHSKTKRYRDGLNPEIFSAVRYLTKAFQFELAVDEQDLKNVREVIRKFDPKRDLQSDYAKAWLEKNGRKMIQNAVDMEYARDTIDRLGLRTKLTRLSKPQEVGTLGWWLNKEPLRSKPVGQGKGKTARQLGIKAVAHETSDFLAYESITRSQQGKPNVFISRKNTPGEAAAHGDGFYTRVGREGARGTGFTIRFEVDPAARQGTDFLLTGDYLVFRNKNALRVIPETLKLSLGEYFKRLMAGGPSDQSDRGVLEKFRVLARTDAAGSSEAELSRIEEAVIRHARQAKPVWQVFADWHELVPGRDPSRWVDALIDNIRAHPDSSELDEVVQALAAKEGLKLPVDLWKRLLQVCVDTRGATSAVAIVSKRFEDKDPARLLRQALRDSPVPADRAFRFLEFAQDMLRFADLPRLTGEEPALRPLIERMKAAEGEERERMNRALAGWTRQYQSDENERVAARVWLQVRRAGELPAVFRKFLEGNIVWEMLPEAAAARELSVEDRVEILTNEPDQWMGVFRDCFRQYVSKDGDRAIADATVLALVRREADFLDDGTVRSAWFKALERLDRGPMVDEVMAAIAHGGDDKLAIILHKEAFRLALEKADAPGRLLIERLLKTEWPFNVWRPIPVQALVERFGKRDRAVLAMAVAASSSDLGGGRRREEILRAYAVRRSSVALKEFGAETVALAGRRQAWKDAVPWLREDFARLVKTVAWGERRHAQCVAQKASILGR